MDISTLEEKIGQIFLVRYPDTNQTAVIDKYKVAGFVFYEKDLGFNNFDEFVKFIYPNLPIRLSYREEELMEQKDSEVESGVIFSNLWFDIVKNAEEE